MSDYPLRTQIGQYIADVCTSMPSNAGGSAYGQPFRYDDEELPFDWVTPGPATYDEEHNYRYTVRTRYLITRAFRHGGEYGSLHEIGDAHIAEMADYIVADEQRRHNDANFAPDFNVVLGASNTQAIPEDSAVGTAPGSYGAVNLVINVTYSYLATDSYSQEVRGG